MIEIELSDGTIVEFPDSMSQGDIKAALRRRFPSMPQPSAAVEPAMPSYMPADTQSPVATQALPDRRILLPQPDTFQPDMPFDPRVMPGTPMPQPLPERVTAPISEAFTGPQFTPDQSALMDAFLPSAPAMRPVQGPPVVDESTAMGDLRAGGYLLRNVGRGAMALPDTSQIAGGARDIASGVRREATTDAFTGRLAELDAEAAAIREAITAPRQGRADPSEVIAAQARLAELDAERNQIALVLGEGGSEATMQESLGEVMAGRAAAAEGAAGLVDRLPAIMADEARAGAIPLNPQAQRILESGDAEVPLREILNAFGEDPLGVLRTFGLRALPASAPAIAAATAGQFIGGPGGAAALGGLVGGGTEVGAAVSEGLAGAMRESGVDLADPAAVEAFLASNADLVGDLLNRALTRGAIMTGAEAAGGGLVGRLAQGAANAGRGARVGAVAAGVPITGAAEGGGEAVAQLVTDGEIDPGAVAAEFLGGTALGAPQAGAQIAAEIARSPQQAPQPSVDTDLAELITQMMAQDQPPAMPAPEQAQTPQAQPAVQMPATAPEALPQRQVAPPAPVTPETPPQPQETPVAQAVVTPEQADAEPMVDPDMPEPSGPEDFAEGRVDELRLQRPLTDRIRRMGGIRSTTIDPQSGERVQTYLAQELRARGITPKTHPSLFNNKTGLVGLDNIDPDTVSNEARQIIPMAEDGLYLSEAALLDGLVQELGAGKPFYLTVAARNAVTDYERAMEDLNRSMQAPVTRPANAPRDPFIFEPNDFFDVSDGAAIVAPVVDQAIAQTGIVLTPEERSRVIQGIAMAERGDVMDAIEREIMRSYQNQISPPAQEATPDADPIPFGNDDPIPADRRAPESDQGDPFDAGSNTGTAEGRAATSAEPRRPAEDGFPTEQTAAGEQAVIHGAEARPDGEGTRQAARTRAEDEARVRQQQSKMRTSVPQDDGGPLFGDDQQQLLDAAGPERVGRATGRLTQRFREASYSNKPAAFDHVYRDLGMDPSEAVNRPVSEQIDIVSKAITQRFGIKIDLPKKTVTKKNIVGRRVAVQRTDLNQREALDQLLNAYRQFQVLAALMGIPEKAISLPHKGTSLTLSLVSGRNLKGALGMYSYTGAGDNRTIHLPDQSNSFAHEWGHALDHWMTLNVDDKAMVGLLTSTMAKQGVQAPLKLAGRLTEAFTHILWSMYGDGVKIGKLRLDLQVQAAQVGPDGQSTPKAKAAEKMLTDMREGRVGSVPPEMWSTYFKTSSDYGAAAGNAAYFASPAEMFARAFEAYVGTKANEEIGGPNAFLSKGADAYMNSTDERAAMTFPREVDAVQFSSAMQGLMNAMRLVNAFGPDAPAKMPDGSRRNWTADLVLKEQREKLAGNLLQREKTALSGLMSSVAALPRLTLSEFIPGAGKAIRNQWRFYAQSASATAFAIAESYRPVTDSKTGKIKRGNAKAHKALMNAISLFAKNPGKGRESTLVFEERVTKETNARLSRLEGALIKAGKGNSAIRKYAYGGEYTLAEGDAETIHMALSGNEKNVPEGLRGLIQDLRSLLNEQRKMMLEAGLAVGWQDNYLPHSYIRDNVDSPEAGARFEAKAKQVYEIMFDRDIANNDDVASQEADIRAIIRGLQAVSESQPDGTAKITTVLSEADLDLVKTYREARTKLKDLERRQKKSDDPDKFVDKIEAAADALETAKADMLDMLGDRWSSYSAQAWRGALVLGSAVDIDGSGPRTSFLKGRTLPPETTAIMREFMSQDPIDIVTRYITSSTRTALAHEFFDGRRADQPNPQEKDRFETMLDAAGEAGARPEDIDKIRAIMQLSVGRRDNADPGVSTMGAVLNTFTTLGLMPFSAFSGFVESGAFALRAGRGRPIRNTLKSYASVVRNSSNLSRAELKKLAKIYGLVAPMTLDNLMQNRHNMDMLADHPRLMQIVSRAYILNMNTPLTIYQRTMMQPLAHNLIMEWLAGDEKGKAFANRELNEVGIVGDLRKDLKSWLDQFDGLPKAEDMVDTNTGDLHHAAKLYGDAMYRIINETIQNPLRTDRAMAASSPYLQHIYAIMSFTAAFTRNVIWRNYERVLASWKDGGGFLSKPANAGYAMAAFLIPAGALVMMQGFSWMLRLLVQDSARLADLMEDEEDPFWQRFWREGLARSGFYGMTDPLIQRVQGLKYESDFTTLPAGAGLSAILGNMQQIGASFTDRNTANTNNSEHRAYQALYGLVVQPLIGAAATALPMGPFSGIASRAAYFYSAAPATRRGFADAIVGERGSKVVGDPPWWQEWGQKK